MNAAQFCLEKAMELQSGRISFKKSDIVKFLKIYTFLSYEDLSKDQLIRLKSIMTDFYTDGYNFCNDKDLPAEKIDMPKFLFM